MQKKWYCSALNFNPRSPRGLRLAAFKTARDSEISIHAAQEGCDWGWREFPTLPALFQSTQPKRAATARRPAFTAWQAISIHAAQEGCDFNSRLQKWKYSDFNPRSPRGLRQDIAQKNVDIITISIHAAQEGCDWATRNDDFVQLYISIHAAQEGCDRYRQYLLTSISRFQSTQPKRAATARRHLGD